MSFLSTLLQQSAPVGQWPGIASVISNGFLEIKQIWFNQSVISMDFGLLADKQKRARVVNDTLGGAAALAITAYQISCATDMIIKNKYVEKSQANDFVDLLCGRVCGVEPKEFQKYVRRYEEVRGDNSTQRFRLGVDVAGYVINAEPPMILSLQISELSQVLTTRSRLVTAKAFGDSREAHRLGSALKEILSSRHRSQVRYS